MTKLLFLGLGAVGLFLVLGGVGSSVGTAFAPILPLVIGAGLLVGLQKGTRSWMPLVLIVVAMFVLFGLMQRAAH